MFVKLLIRLSPDTTFSPGSTAMKVPFSLLPTSKASGPVLSVCGDGGLCGT